MPIEQIHSEEVADPDWPAMPTETEIYILPDGRIVIADLPAELAAVLAELGETELYPVLTQAASTRDDMAKRNGNE